MDESLLKWHLAYGSCESEGILDRRGVVVGASSGDLKSARLVEVDSCQVRRADFQKRFVRAISGGPVQGLCQQRSSSAAASRSRIDAKI